MDRKTKFISAASVVGIVLAGSTAVAANVGILGQADPAGLGQLSAAAEAAPLEPQVIDIQLEPQNLAPTIVSLEDSQSPTATPAAGQPFIVEDAGVVTIESVGQGLRIMDVAPNAGWSYVANDAGDSTVSVTFDSDKATYVFTASVQGDGSVLATVEQPIIEFVTGPASPRSSAEVYQDGDHDEYEDDDDDHEDDDDDEDDVDDEEDDDDEEHEGRDDDD